MKNKISDLRDHMFAALERLANEDMKDDELKNEIAKASAIADLGKVIVESAKTELLYAKVTADYKQIPTKFLEAPKKEEVEPEPEKIVRPPAVYTNKSFSEEIETR